MTSRRAVWVVLLSLVAASPAAAQRYTALRDGDVIRIGDRAAGVAVAVVPSIGNLAIEMTVNGHNVLRWPFATLEEFKKKPGMSGIPFMGPWANRLDEQAFYANGRRYPFDMDLGNVRGAIPIHGFLTLNDRWQVVSVAATPASASVTSRLEFFREPAWMRQWPFAHTIDMTYELREGVLEVATSITNMSSEPMPVAVGFHPYFQLTDSPRDEWTISVGARTHWRVTPDKLPTGVTEPIERVFPDPRAARLRDHDLDDVFSDLVRDARGRATMSVTGRAQKLEVFIGPNYRAAVVWAPAPQNFICFEPMAAVTNGLNLAHRRAYDDLQSIPPGGVWRESFWIRATGF